LIVFENELPPLRWEFHSESGAFCVVVCVIVSLFVQQNVSANAPAATLESKPAEALTIEMSTVAACACSAPSPGTGMPRAPTRSSDASAILPSFFGEVERAPSTPGWSGNVRPWRTS
jgi:hypothetical protein